MNNFKKLNEELKNIEEYDNIFIDEYHEEVKEEIDNLIEVLNNLRQNCDKKLDELSWIPSRNLKDRFTLEVAKLGVEISEKLQNIIDKAD